MKSRTKELRFYEPRRAKRIGRRMSQRARHSGSRNPRSSRPKEVKAIKAAADEAEACYRRAKRKHARESRAARVALESLDGQVHRLERLGGLDGWPGALGEYRGGLWCRSQRNPGRVLSNGKFDARKVAVTPPTPASASSTGRDFSSAYRFRIEFAPPMAAAVARRRAPARCSRCGITTS